MIDRISVLVVLFACLGGGTASAQIARGMIVGTVSDESKAMLPV